MSVETILLVDDEAAILDLSRMYLEREGFRVFCVTTGFQVLNSFQSIHPDLILLNMVLPGLDGMDVCRRLRGENNPVPILIMAPTPEDLQKLAVMDIEADDYFLKPFNPRELVARVKAALRRPRLTESKKHTILKVGIVKLDESKREVTAGEKKIPLRMQEYELLHVLMKASGKTVTREQLLRDAWGFNFPGQVESVDIHIAKIYRKLGSKAIKIEKSPEGFKLAGL